MLLAIPATAVLGMLLEATLLRTLYARDHLSQVLATFALILIINESVRMIWGTDMALSAPAVLAGPVEIVPGLLYPSYRLVIILVGAALAVLLYLLVARTRLGALVRAGASNREMAMAMGVEHPPPLHGGVRHRRRPCAPSPAPCSGRSSRCRSAWARASSSSRSSSS